MLLPALVVLCALLARGWRLSPAWALLVLTQRIGGATADTPPPHSGGGVTVLVAASVDYVCPLNNWLLRTRTVSAVHVSLAALHPRACHLPGTSGSA